MNIVIGWKSMNEITPEVFFRNYSFFLNSLWFTLIHSSSYPQSYWHTVLVYVFFSLQHVFFQQSMRLPQTNAHHLPDLSVCNWDSWTWLPLSQLSVVQESQRAKTSNVSYRVCWHVKFWEALSRYLLLWIAERLKGDPISKRHKVKHF